MTHALPSEGWGRSLLQGERQPQEPAPPSAGGLFQRILAQQQQSEAATEGLQQPTQESTGSEPPPWDHAMAPGGTPDGQMPSEASHEHPLGLGIEPTQALLTAADAPTAEPQGVGQAARAPMGRTHEDNLPGGVEHGDDTFRSPNPHRKGGVGKLVAAFEKPGSQARPQQTVQRPVIPSPFTEPTEDPLPREPSPSRLPAPPAADTPALPTPVNGHEQPPQDVQLQSPSRLPSPPAASPTPPRAEEIEPPFDGNPSPAGVPDKPPGSITPGGSQNGLMGKSSSSAALKFGPNSDLMKTLEEARVAINKPLLPKPEDGWSPVAASPDPARKAGVGTRSVDRGISLSMGELEQKSTSASLTGLPSSRIITRASTGTKCMSRLPNPPPPPPPQNTYRRLHASAG